MKQLEKIANIVDAIVSYVGMVLFAILIVACVGQVFFRFVLNHSLSWTEELARFCFIWMHLIGASLLIRTKGHATVTVILDLLHGTAKKIFDIFIDLIIMLNGSVMVYSGMQLVQSSRHNLSPSLSVPMWIINASVFVGGALLIFQALVQLILELSSKDHKDKVGDEV
jgi:TRAP-type C4-dicarboxylate transport system permease small subunit